MSKTEDFLSRWSRLKGASGVEESGAEDVLRGQGCGGFGVGEDEEQVRSHAATDAIEEVP